MLALLALHLTKSCQSPGYPVLFFCHIRLRATQASEGNTTTTHGTQCYSGQRCT